MLAEIITDLEMHKVENLIQQQLLVLAKESHQFITLIEEVRSNG
jgi:hypothetical protein